MLWFLLGIVFPTVRPYRPVNLLSAIPLQWMLNMSYAAVGYGVLGWYLVKKQPSLRLGWLCAALGLVITVVPTLLLSARKGALDDQFLGGMTLGVCLLAAGGFILLRRLGGALRGHGKGAVAGA